MTDSEPDWSSYDPESPFFQSERDSNGRWARLRCCHLEWEPTGPGSSDPLTALIEAEDDARAAWFCSRFTSELMRLRLPLSRDARRRLQRRLLEELERARVFSTWLSGVLRARGTRTRTWKRQAKHSAHNPRRWRPDSR